MVLAYIMLTVAIGKMNSIIEELKGMEFIETINSVTGPCDIIIKVKADDLHCLKEDILLRIYNIDGIMDTCTSLVIEL